MIHEKERLPEDREGITHHFAITDRNGQTTDGYLTVSCYGDGRPGEVFMKIGKAGAESAVWDQLAIIFSVALQHGAPLENICDKLKATNFEPSGYTTNSEIPRCTSVSDYVARYMMSKFPKKEASA